MKDQRNIFLTNLTARAAFITDQERRHFRTRLDAGWGTDVQFFSTLSLTSFCFKVAQRPQKTSPAALLSSFLKKKSLTSFEQLVWTLEHLFDTFQVFWKSILVASSGERSEPERIYFPLNPPILKACSRFDGWFPSRQLDCEWPRVSVAFLGPRFFFGKGQNRVTNFDPERSSTNNL